MLHHSCTFGEWPNVVVAGSNFTIQGIFMAIGHKLRFHNQVRQRT